MQERDVDDAKCLVIGGFKSIMEQFKKLKTDRAFCSLSAGVSLFPAFSWASRCLREPRAPSIMDCLVGEWDMPVSWVIPHKEEKFATLWEMYAGPLSVLICCGIPDVAKAAVK